ncbi:MAG: hypothetical protein WC989_00070 [Micavibrio sp.]
MHKKYPGNAPRPATRIFPALLIGAALISVGACAAGEEFREITAERIARPAFMVERSFRAQEMDFKLWERMHARHAPVNIYIEGDGETLYHMGGVTKEPSPENPVALHLASRDNAENLLYIARPCQYRESPDPKQCDPKYWSNRRFAPEVITAYNEIIDEVKRRYDLTDINIIGYGGGANIAAAIAARRGDVKSLRTVAGALAPDLVYTNPKEPLDGDSVKANALAPQLARLPQHHFVGAGDDVVPASVYHSYRAALGESDCVHYTLVPDADHTLGWVQKWPDFLTYTVACPSDEIFDKDAMQNYTPAPLPPAKDYSPYK